MAFEKPWPSVTKLLLQELGAERLLLDLDERSVGKVTGFCRLCALISFKGVSALQEDDIDGDTADKGA
jgi:hypothetical protein